MMLRAVVFLVVCCVGINATIFGRNSQIDTEHHRAAASSLQRLLTHQQARLHPTTPTLAARDLAQERLFTTFTEKKYTGWSDSKIGAMMGLANEAGMYKAALQLKSLLAEHNLNVATAESLTAGMIASTLVDVPGNGKVVYGGMVVYDTDAKYQYLGVETQGVYSLTTASQMAQGLLHAGRALVGVAVTGDAMPVPENKENLGVVYMGVAIRTKRGIATYTDKVEFCSLSANSGMCDAWKKLHLGGGQFAPFQFTNVLATRIRRSTVNEALLFAKRTIDEYVQEHGVDSFNAAFTSCEMYDSVCRPSPVIYAQVAGCATKEYCDHHSIESIRKPRRHPTKEVQDEQDETVTISSTVEELAKSVEVISGNQPEKHAKVLQAFQKERTVYASKGHGRSGCIHSFLDGHNLPVDDIIAHLSHGVKSSKRGVTAVIRVEKEIPQCDACSTFSSTTSGVSESSIYYTGTPCTSQDAVEMYGPQRLVVVDDGALNRRAIDEIRFVMQMNGFVEWKPKADEYPIWPDDNSNAYFTILNSVEIPDILHYMPYIDIIGMADAAIVSSAVDLDLGNVVAGITNKPVTVLSVNQYSEDHGKFGQYAMLDYCNTGVAVSHPDEGYLSAMWNLRVFAFRHKFVVQGNWAQYRSEYSSYVDFESIFVDDPDTQLDMKTVFKDRMKKYNPNYRVGYAMMSSRFGKTPEQLLNGITWGQKSQPKFSVMVEPGMAELVKKAGNAKKDGLGDEIHYNPVSQTLYWGTAPKPDSMRWSSVPVHVCVVTAGVADQAVGYQVQEVLELNGISAEFVQDLGVNSISQDTLKVEKLLDRCNLFIACAGMEGTLPEVVAQVSDAPVIAVPVDVGYGAHLSGLTTVNVMMKYPTPGMTFVNVGNGFGAAMIAISLVDPTYHD